MARVLISMTDNFLNSIDKIAKNEQRSRSELIREALRVYIQKTKKISPKKAMQEASLLENLLD